MFSFDFFPDLKSIGILLLVSLVCIVVRLKWQKKWITSLPFIIVVCILVPFFMNKGSFCGALGGWSGQSWGDCSCFGVKYGGLWTSNSCIGIRTACYDSDGFYMGTTPLSEGREAAIAYRAEWARVTYQENWDGKVYLKQMSGGFQGDDSAPDGWTKLPDIYGVRVGISCGYMDQEYEEIRKGGKN